MRTLKPTISPSQAMTLKFCPRLWTIRYIKGLGVMERLDYKMLFGGMYHKVAEAIDKQQGPQAALDSYIEEAKLRPTYLSSDSLLLDHCKGEMIDRMIPGYLNFLNNAESELGPLTTLDVELPIEVNVGPCILKCIPDKVVSDAGGNLWVVERKTTSRDDSEWQRQWVLNHQTTCEAIAAELHYNRPIQGVLIEQVVVTRKRAKVWPHYPLPQPIHSATWHPWRPVPKSQHVKNDCIRFLEDIVLELSHRVNEWLLNSDIMAAAPNPANCHRCSLHGVCRGAIQPDDILTQVRDPEPWSQPDD